MPQPPNPICLQCIDYSRMEAKRVHGPHGDGCWKDNACDRKRNHYRHRKESNAKRRGEYADQKAKITPDKTTETFSIPVLAPPVALLYLYKEKPKDAHLHALAISVWQGSEKLAAVEAVHCMGMTNTQVNRYLKEVLKVLGERYGITEFEPPIRMEPTECEIAECPLKDKLHVPAT
ncbi:hypothetical protein HRE53_31700 (plasmid) [Acaryochloris sp. 'Moss Beach']|uniref:hypothetical protein n=1 Tax=Acaryochloris sp. 'Moss Beach' TaxID=2740837 RepID=UPI001F25937E|nr:hypothetical protein [Acaryochloris sp. 'Moss Beach']UJB73259.1 hypothetical protein HRE53_31700 [Acaryochloris sp. 'Moss Beach']